MIELRDGKVVVKCDNPDCKSELEYEFPLTNFFDDFHAIGWWYLSGRVYCCHNCCEKERNREQYEREKHKRFLHEIRDDAVWIIKRLCWESTLTELEQACIAMKAIRDAVSRMECKRPECEVSSIPIDKLFEDGNADDFSLYLYE